MNRETLSELVKKSQGGDREALRELLLHAHTPVLYQCRKLLGDEETARMLTEEILVFLAQKLDSLEDPDGFEKWVGGITAARAMRTLREMEKKEAAAPEKQVSFPSETLNKAQTAQVAALLADALPEKYRMCLILRTCCGLKPMAVGKLLGLEEETVDQYLEKAENAINHQMQRYRERGVTFAEGITLYGLLRRAMYLEPEAELAEAAVAGILGVPVPVETVEEAPRRGLSAGQLLGLIAITVAVLVLVVMLLPNLFRNMTTALTQRMETAWAVTAEPAQEIEIAAETMPAETEALATQSPVTENVPTEAAPTDPPVTEAAPVPQESTSAEAPATEAESE